MEKSPAPFLRVFVYGTLKRGFGNHALLTGVEFAGTGVVYGRLYDVGVPALTPAPKTVLAAGTGDFARDHARQAEAEGGPAPAPGRGGWSHVRGEIYHVRRPETLARLDRLEGFRPGRGSLYTRSLVAAETDVGARPAWVYGMDAPGGRRLAAPAGEAEVRWPARGPGLQIPPPGEGRHRVFAYGSLLSGRDARRTAPRAFWRGRALLPAHRLALTQYSACRGGGVADVVPDGQHGVWGGLYEMDGNGLAHLDRREGHPVVYRREPVTVWADGCPDLPLTAWTYRVVNPGADAVPASAAYKSIILGGARERALPKTYIRECVATLPARARPGPPREGASRRDADQAWMDRIAAW